VEIHFDITNPGETVPNTEHPVELRTTLEPPHEHEPEPSPEPSPTEEPSPSPEEGEAVRSNVWHPSSRQGRAQPRQHLRRLRESK